MKKLTPTINSSLPVPAYEQLIRNIGQTLQAGRVQAYRAAEQIAVQTRWEIGRHIVEFEQQGNEKAEYGTYLLDRLAQDLTNSVWERFFTNQRGVYQENIPDIPNWSDSV